MISDSPKMKIYEQFDLRVLKAFISIRVCSHRGSWCLKSLQNKIVMNDFKWLGGCLEYKVERMLKVKNFIRFEAFWDLILKF
jgi:hypothetical protein